MVVIDEVSAAPRPGSVRPSSTPHRVGGRTTSAYGRYIGHVKWFSDTLNYGFITMCSRVSLHPPSLTAEGPATAAAAEAAATGRDIFVHHTGVLPQISSYKTLRKGEYVSMNLCVGSHGPQAIDVTGIAGGPLMCDTDALASLSIAAVAPAALASAEGFPPSAAYGAGFRGGGRDGSSGGRRIVAGCHPWWLDAQPTVPPPPTTAPDQRWCPQLRATQPPPPPPPPRPPTPPPLHLV